MVRKLSAEFFGTFWLVFGGCGSAVLAAAFPELGIGFVGVSLAFGLTVLTWPMPLAEFPGDISIPPYRWDWQLADGSRGRNSYPTGLPRSPEQSWRRPHSMPLLPARPGSPLAVLRPTVSANSRPAGIRCRQLY